MSMNSILLKAKAQDIIRNSNPKVIRVAIIFLCISLIFGMLSTYLMGSTFTQKDIEQITAHIESGNTEYAIEYMMDKMPSAGSQAVDLLIQFVMSIVSVGFVIFLLNTIRGNGPCYGNLLDGFGFPFRIIFLDILTGILIGLWSLLLVVPGIIAIYRYRMAKYLLIDHPEYSILDCLRESKRMMAGRKWDLFLLDLSFVGWALLTMLPAIGWLVQIWTTPYFSTTYALYYEQLAGRYDAGSDYVNFQRDHSEWL